ncbi:MAG: ABC transporter permease [Spirochaetes bacterium]|nr:ABC transporter permease [Spirochaetota bacterium]
MIGTHYTKSLGTFIMIAWRNLWRQKRRSLVVISSMAIGVFAMVFSIGFMNGMTLQMVENTINTTLGHISIHRVGYRDSMKLKYNFSPDEGRYRVLEETPGVVAFAPRVKIKGMISSAETTRGVMLVGIDPTRERSVSSIGDYILPEDGGRFIQDPAAEELLISKSLAEKLDLRVGERAVLRVVDESSEMTGVGLRIAGLYESPVESFDSFVIFTGIKQLQKITGIGGNVSEIIVRTKNRDAVDAVKKRMKGAGGPGIEILTWKEMEPNLVSYIKLQDMVIYIFFMIMFITVIFSIANTLIMSIMERFHELGVMKCIGTRPSHIFFMVIFEAVNLGIVGLVAGLAITVPLVLILGATGLDFSFAMEAMRKWKIGTTIYPMLLAKDIIAAVAIVLITTVTASIYPAVKAARIKPLEALHFI